MAGVAAHGAATQRVTPRPTWQFLTNQPVVLIFIVQHPESTVRTIAQGVGLTERATLALLRDLDEEGLIDRHRNGRRNTYVVRYERMLGMVADASEMNLAVGAVVGALISISPEGAAATRKHHKPGPDDRRPRVGKWDFFTNHMMMLGAIARDPAMTVRDLAIATRITERAVVQILNQLEAEQIVVRHREGRRNSYTIDLDAFASFRGWRYESWTMPQRLVDVASNGIRSLLRR
jgi:DNA-binding MarR family transcriptional regulator